MYNYDYSDVRGEHTIKVAELTCDGKGNINIKHCIEPVDTHFSSGDIWGVKTNTFVPVTAIMLSPNYWGDNAIGNKHLFFMLDGCKNPDTPNGWYNEYLSADLTNHKRVFEALGSRAKVAESDDQLSGAEDGRAFSSRCHDYRKDRSQDSRDDRTQHQSQEPEDTHARLNAVRYRKGRRWRHHVPFHHGKQSVRP